MLSVSDIARMIVDHFSLTENSEQVIDNELDDVIESYFTEQTGDCLLAYSWMDELCKEINSILG